MPTVILASLVAVSLAAAPDEDNPTPPVRVLLVTGVDHPAHHWKETGRSSADCSRREADVW